MVEQPHEGPVVILPGTDELNRGDQALVWQTKSIAERAGFSGKYKMLISPGGASEQSRVHGITPLVPLLRHPSTRYKPTTNLKYGVALTLIWGAIAVGDTVRCLGLLTRLGRWLMRPLLSLEERKTLNAIETSSACFVKGGGFIHSTSSVADPYRAFFFLFHIFLAQSFGKKVFVMPNSFGPLNGRLYRKIVRTALNRCSIVTARESISQSALAGIEIESQIFPDLAFGLQGVKPTSPSPIAAIRRDQPNKKIVGLTARPYRFPGAPDPKAAYTRYVAEMANFIALLKNDGHLPVFIEHVISDGHHESDISAIEDVMRHEGAVDTPIISVPDFNCEGLKSLYGECDYVVGTRFHSVIFALSEGTPAIAIAYGGNKGLGIMRDANLEEFVTPIEEFSAQRAFAQFSQLSAMEDIDVRLLDLRERYRADHDRLVGLVKDLR